MSLILRRFRLKTLESLFNTPKRLCSAEPKLKRTLPHGPDLKEFLIAGKNLPKPNHPLTEVDNVPYLKNISLDGNNRKVHFEVYGCQMNKSDTEIVWSILKASGYRKVEDIKDADICLLITCSVREGAETKIWNRLQHISAMKKNRSRKKGPLQIGILGCMAERLKTQVLEKEKWVDLVAGPDSYKDLPRLLAISRGNHSAVNVLLSLDETYADVMPVRLDENSTSAYVSIMRGCDNMCSYCIVPFTRGKERSRPIESIESEVRALAEQGVKEVTLLGQNVNSYRYLAKDGEAQAEATSLVSGFKTVYKPKVGGVRFGELLRRVAEAVPEVRIRFTSPHPKDFPDEVLTVIQQFPNICKSLHLPAQSGSSSCLDRMRRGYTREAYLDLVHHVRTILPTVSLSSDFICGFCGETDTEFEETLSLINKVKFNVAFLFAYSMREKTTAHRRFVDDVPAGVKNERLRRMVEAFRKGAEELNARMVGETQLILVEGTSKRSDLELFGRNDSNLKVIIPSQVIPEAKGAIGVAQIQPGDYVAVKVDFSNSQILKGRPLYHTTLQGFYAK